MPWRRAATSRHDGVDFLVRRLDREAWFARLLGAGLKLFGETRAFAQFSQHGRRTGSDVRGRADLRPDVAGVRGARLRRMQGAGSCLDHLLALKVHTLKQALPHRTSKDAEDVEMLTRRNRLDLRDPHYEQFS
jgi:hypothetical protein